MDSTIYIALLIIAVFVLFGLAVSWRNNYKKKIENKKLLSEFDGFVIACNLAIDKKQTLNTNMIGIDRLNLKLVFLDRSKTPHQFHLIDLRELSACHLMKEKNPSNGHINNIYLECIFRGKDKPAIALPFYNEMKDDLFKLMRLSKKASYWEKSINIFRESALLSA